MKRRHFLQLLFAVSGTAREPDKTNTPGRPAAEIRGKIEKVQITPGAGLPSLVVATDSGAVRVFLGPLRYLMESDFNPKAGEQVEVTGLWLEKDIVAWAVTLPASKRTLKLREPDGTPAWRGFGRRLQRHGPTAR